MSNFEDTIRNAGKTPGEWAPTQGGKQARPLLLSQQIDLARELRKVLMMQEDALAKELEQAKELLHHMKFGGGS